MNWTFKCIREQRAKGQCLFLETRMESIVRSMGLMMLGWAIKPDTGQRLEVWVVMISWGPDGHPSSEQRSVIGREKGSLSLTLPRSLWEVLGHRVAWGFKTTALNTWGWWQVSQTQEWRQVLSTKYLWLSAEENVKSLYGIFHIPSSTRLPQEKTIPWRWAQRWKCRHFTQENNVLWERLSRNKR